MQSLSQSPFLQALGYAIINSLWQMALLWIVVVLLNGLLRFSTPVKYRMALLGQVTGFTWFVVTFRFYYQQCAATIALAASLGNPEKTGWLITPSSPDFKATLLSYLIKAEEVLPYLSAAYICLLLFLLMRWVRQYRHTQVIRTASLQKIDVEWRLFVQRISTQLSIRPNVRIYLSSLINSPMTIGYLKPIVLIPLASINHLSTEQMEAVILHELAHIKRADYLINLLQTVIETTLFFNPFAQLLGKLIRKERENSCDDWVLQFQYNPTMYAEALLRIAYLQRQPSMAMQAAGTGKGDLLHRVKRMLNQQEKNFPYRQQLFALVLMTGLLSCVAWLQPIATASPAASSIHQQQEVMEPMTAKVENPLFNPVFFLTKPLQEEVSKAVLHSLTIAQDALTAKQQLQHTLHQITPALAAQVQQIPHQVQEQLTLAQENLHTELDHSTLLNNGEQSAVTLALSLLDSAQLNRSIRLGLEEGIRSINIDKIRQEIARATKEVSRLSTRQRQQEALVLNKQQLQQLILDIPSLLLQNNAAEPAATPEPPKPPVRMVEKPVPSPQQLSNLHKKVTTLESYRAKFMQFKYTFDSLQRLSRFKMMAIQQQKAQARAQEKQLWSYRQPVYVEVDTEQSIFHPADEPSVEEVRLPDNLEEEELSLPGTPAPAAPTPAATPAATYRYKKVNILIRRHNPTTPPGINESPVKVLTARKHNDHINLSIEITEK